MKFNKEDKSKKTKVTDVSNDQLGENASEEYKSSEYSNSSKCSKNKKH